MLDQKQLKENSEFLDSMGNLCVAYEQISVMKMKKIKDAVLYTRSFYDELAGVYYQVKTTYRDQVKQLVKKKKIKDPQKLLLMGKNDRSVAILLSANNRLYGDILNKVFYKFIAETKDQNVDLVVVGRLAKEMLAEYNLKRSYTYFEIPDIDLTVEDLKPVINMIIPYSKINVFYGRYDSFFSQLAINRNISGDVEIETGSDLSEQKFYYFEPNLKKILLFFETQIFSNLFKQTAYDGQLARYASRISAMDTALGVIEKEARYTTAMRIKAHNNLVERRQNERVAQSLLRRVN